jgi:hypothetical protein
MAANAKLIRAAMAMADRFERVALDYNGVMDKADKRLLERVQAAIKAVEEKRC